MFFVLQGPFCCLFMFYLIFEDYWANLKDDNNDKMYGDIFSAARMEFENNLIDLQ